MQPGLLAEMMSKYAEDRCHFRERAPRLLRSHHTCKQVDVLHKAVVEHEKTIFQARQFKTGRMLDKISQNPVVTIQGLPKWIESGFGFKTPLNFGKIEAAFFHGHQGF